MKIGFLYAGQGSQVAGMGKGFYESDPDFKKIYDTAPVSFDLKETCFSGENLNDTRYTQPCMVAFAIGVTEILKKNHIIPQVVAGLSLGEYSALQASGVWDSLTAIALAEFRGCAMAKAVEGMDSSMMAILALDRGKVAEACKRASHLGVVEIANYNCPGQVVIGGKKEAVAQAAIYAKELGARRAMALNVSGPFHTSLLASASTDLREYFKTIAFAPMNIPVIFNCLGDVKNHTDSIASLLEKQVMSSVYLEDTILKMKELGIDTVVEIGPGKVLSGFVRKTVEGMST